MVKKNKSDSNNPRKARQYKDAELRRLFALSGNQCGHPDCNTTLVSEDGNYTFAKIAHISAASKNGPRYDPNMTDDERRSIDNLILLCDEHHIIIDNINTVDQYPIELIKQWKTDHIKSITKKEDKISNHSLQALSIELNSNFDYISNLILNDLPNIITENLIQDKRSSEEDDDVENVIWARNLRNELSKEEYSLVLDDDDDLEIFRCYDWLIQDFLRKMATKNGRNKSVLSLSYMTEAFNASVRYLCYVQLAQVLQKNLKPKLKITSEFIQMTDNNFESFNYPNFLLSLTEVVGEDGFIEELWPLIEKLRNPESNISPIFNFLNVQRNKLIKGKIKNDSKIQDLYDQYLTSLIHWLKELAFISQYRLVSIRDINLSYRIGSSPLTYVHRYGELHGINVRKKHGKATKTIKIKEEFTYSKSVLLFKGNNIAECLKKIKEKEEHISLSPLIIDKSVYDETKQKDMPELFYYAGFNSKSNKYIYIPYNRELLLETTKKAKALFPPVDVSSTNTENSGLDDLHSQLDEVMQPFILIDS